MNVPAALCLSASFPDSARSSKEGRQLPHNPLSYLLWLGFHRDENAKESGGSSPKEAVIPGPVPPRLRKL